MTLSESKISIIGLGLIGSSLARALKRHNKDQYIIAYDLNSKNLDIAKNEAFINEAATDFKSTVEDADIVIICTKLSAYEDVTKEISPYLKDKAIISDVGSVKEETSRIIRDNLLPQQRKYFVAAHPIAGTEKSGVEAGFAELFDGKKLIITDQTYEESVQKISRMWQNCGSFVKFLNSETHDLIYAQISHLPQLIAFVFYDFFQKNASNIKESLEAGGVNFRKFVRISNSNPKLWEDIFFYNKKALFVSLNNFIRNFSSLTASNMQNRIENAKIKRNKYCDSDSNNESENLALKASGEDEEYLISTLPQLIACALAESADNIEYSGSGFCDMTQILNQKTPLVEINKNITEEFLHTLENFL